MLQLCGATEPAFAEPQNSAGQTHVHALLTSFLLFPGTNAHPLCSEKHFPLFPRVVIQFKGIPSEVEVDMSKPEEGRMSKAGQVLVDLATKRVY